jgi:hypothetical protein
MAGASWNEGDRAIGMLTKVLADPPAPPAMARSVSP